MELYDEIRNELLEEEALWALEEEPIEEPLENSQPVPCPNCAKSLESHDEAGTVSNSTFIIESNDFTDPRPIYISEMIAHYQYLRYGNRPFSMPICIV